MLIARGDLSRARAVLTEALESASEIGMHTLATKIRADLDRLG
jgi:hypothetical protein